MATSWVEITSIEHGHGGRGWELGTCLWSPTRNRDGADRYGLMRNAVPGDDVLHFVMARWPDGTTERRLVGRSEVARPCVTVQTEPPIAGAWKGFPEYYRIDLANYVEFSVMPRVDQFAREHVQELLAESQISGYPFTRYGDGVRLAAGLYLRRCSPWLQSALLAATADPLPSTSARRTARVVLDPYLSANETVELPTGRLFEYDPATRERGCRGHARTQNTLAAFLQSNGLEPMRPIPPMPEVDLAWHLQAGGLAIAEVKSLTLENETTQLRLGVGQLLHYSYLLREQGLALRALILERAPTDLAWLEITRKLGIVLAWPATFGPTLIGQE